VPDRTDFTLSGKRVSTIGVSLAVVKYMTTPVAMVWMWGR
jgi:hypothetical protein